MYVSYKYTYLHILSSQELAAWIHMFIYVIELKKLNKNQILDKINSQV